jgi:glycosyltransferase involved in cell wall biosynthesis
MIETRQYINNAIFVIIGSGDVENELFEKVKDLKLTNKVKFIAKIPPETLQKLTPLADLGLSIEEDLGLNYRFTLPNKVFDYIQAQVPILVSDLVEMKQIIEKYNVGEIILDRNPLALANQITAILQKNKDVYSKQLIKASNELIWKKESKQLIKLFDEEYHN